MASTTLSLLAGEAVHVSAAEIGVLGAGVGLVGTLVTLLFSRRVPHHRAAASATWSMAGLVVSLLVLAVAPSFGVLAVGVGGMLGVVSLPRGRRSGLGLALMATSMLVLFAAPAWHLGPLATTGFLAAFLPGLWLVAGPSDIGRRPATRSPSEMLPALPGNGPPAPTEPAA